MNNLQKVIMLSVLSIGLLALPKTALADFKSKIINSCKMYQQGKDTSEINACKLYIDGFIDSSLHTEDGVEQPKAMIEDNLLASQSNFLERAYRTRVLTTSALKNDELHHFCIPLEYDRRKIASTIAKSMDISQLANKHLSEVVFETLVADFPCQ